MRLLKICVCVIACVAARVQAQCGWESLSSGMNNLVRALAVLPNGDLVAGGEFTRVGGVAVNYIARWNGSTWQTMGSGMNGSVYALAVLPNGDLVAGGWFTTAGGVNVSRIARWNGTNWSAIGPGFNEIVFSIKVLANGDIVAGGDFTTNSLGWTLNRIARWDGSTWLPLGSGFNNSVRALTLLPSGDLVAAGFFSTAGGLNANKIASWNGTNWSALGSGIGGLNSAVEELAVLANGDLVAGGDFTSAGGVSVNDLARWNGSTWSAIGTGIGGVSVEALVVLPNGDLVVGGGFNTAGGVSANNLARWNGNAWSAIGSGTTGVICTLAVLPEADIAVGGWFNTAGVFTTNNIARWNNDAPVLHEQPISTEICIGQSKTINVVSSDADHFQWRRNGMQIAGANSSAYSIPSVNLTDDGHYDCVISNSCGSVTSEVATITVLTPQILNPPLDQSVNVDQPVNFVVETDESSPCQSSLQFQWQRRDPLVADDNAPGAWMTLQNGGGIFGATSANLLILRPTPGLATGYRCRITGGCGCEFADSSVYYTSTVNYSAACPSDFNLDGSVDGDDVIAFFERWDGGC